MPLILHVTTTYLDFIVFSNGQIWTFLDSIGYFVKVVFDSKFTIGYEISKKTK